MLKRTKITSDARTLCIYFILVTGHGAGASPLLRMLISLGSNRAVPTPTKSYYATDREWV